MKKNLKIGILDKSNFQVVPFISFITNYQGIIINYYPVELNITLLNITLLPNF